MVKFSIIIVNYNVKYFLEQCLCSVKKAIGEWLMSSGEWKTQVFVVDNNSADGSIEYLEPRFPFVRFISNKENTGFARANNQALNLAAGQYILFLNPDTILPEDFFITCIGFMETHQSTAAVGVQMIDGAGKFLKESKRGFPATWAAFCKLSGLTALLPNSKIFAKYYLGHLDRNHNHEVEALSGACMLIRKEALDKCGGFDERFFMYAEDIDLSYRLQQLGYINYYLADVCIIHFKGESTTKDLRYVKLFYKAMVQFVQKHYHGKRGVLYLRFLQTAIALRGVFAAGSLKLVKTASKQETWETRVYLQGDDHSIKAVRTSLPDSHKLNFVQTPNESTEIILCEGDQYSFKDLIKTMSLSPEKNYKIHAHHSSSIVGSYDSSYTGKVTILK